MATQARVFRFGAATCGGGELTEWHICEVVEWIGDDRLCEPEWDPVDSALLVIVWNAGNAVMTCGWPMSGAAIGEYRGTLTPSCDESEDEEPCSLL